MPLRVKETMAKPSGLLESSVYAEGKSGEAAQPARPAMSSEDNSVLLIIFLSFPVSPQWSGYFRMSG
ncbi:protein of unknown function [Denitratisoma oestradiolicum]|uniref:Uncharacterized protein n=1 Tax=Denitratisoma oestradiolicum TaxID=311182 RepID=A0A6S6XXK0_9PROT|nr:protein of unknown function [Denitratisoma oestradiolicum]